MISAVLGGIFVALIAGGIGAMVYLKQKRMLNKTNKLALIALVCLSALLLAVVPLSLHTVQPGQVGVVKVWGNAKHVRKSGTYFDFWISNEYDLYDTTVQQEDIVTACYSMDAQTMDVSFVVQYQIQADNAIEIANNYGGLDRLSQRIKAIAEDKAKTVLSQKSAMKIIETRSTISGEIEQNIKDAVTVDYCVDIVTVVVTNIDFSDAFEEIVEEKMIAEQEKLKAEYEKEKAIIEAEKELEVTKLRAEANIAEAQGDAEATLVKAQAEANAIKHKSIEVARMLGFTITEKAVADGIEYNIDFEGKTAEEVALISEYLKYIAYLEAWDGKLPTVTDGSASVIIPTPQP